MPGVQKPLSVDPCHYHSSSNKQLKAHYQYLPSDSISPEPRNAHETFYQSEEEAVELYAAKRNVLKGCSVISFNQTETVWLWSNSPSMSLSPALHKHKPLLLWLGPNCCVKALVLCEREQHTCSSLSSRKRQTFCRSLPPQEWISIVTHI